MGWQTVEHWRGTTEHGTTWEITLKELRDIWAHAWRVEWWQPGTIHRGESFTDDNREHDARAFCAAKLAEIDATWERIG